MLIIVLLCFKFISLLLWQDQMCLIMERDPAEVNRSCLPRGRYIWSVWLLIFPLHGLCNSPAPQWRCRGRKGRSAEPQQREKGHQGGHKRPEWCIEIVWMGNNSKRSRFGLRWSCLWCCMCINAVSWTEITKKTLGLATGHAVIAVEKSVLF